MYISGSPTTAEKRIHQHCKSVADYDLYTQEVGVGNFSQNPGVVALYKKIYKEMAKKRDILNITEMIFGQT